MRQSPDEQQVLATGEIVVDGGVLAGQPDTAAHAVRIFRATASAKIRQFTGPGHDMKEQPGEPADSPGPAGDWRAAVMKSIGKTTAFLPDALRPQALLAAVPAAPPTANMYSATFQRGPLDDHGSFEYVFKLVCATIEYELWPVENRQSGAVQPAATGRR